MKITKKILAVGMILGIGTTLAACTPATQEQGNVGKTTSAGVTTSEAANGKKADSKPRVGIIKSTEMKSCDIKPGDVVAKGIVTLPEDMSGSIKISVSWVDSKTSAVLAQGVQTIKNATPGKETEWSISAKLDKTPAKVKCVLGAKALGSQ